MLGTSVGSAAIERSPGLARGWVMRDIVKEYATGLVSAGENGLVRRFGVLHRAQLVAVADVNIELRFHVWRCLRRRLSPNGICLGWVNVRCHQKAPGLVA